LIFFLSLTLFEKTMEEVKWTGPAVDPDSAFEKALASTNPTSAPESTPKKSKY